MIEKFFDTMRNDPKAKELVKAMPVPKTDEEAVEAYTKLAKELGFDLTADEIKSGLKAMESSRKAQSDKVSLDAEDLENVAGGANLGCSDTHSPGEWCWFSDSCSVIINFYEGDSNDPFKGMNMNDEYEVEEILDGDHCLGAAANLAGDDKF